MSFPFSSKKKKQKEMIENQDRQLREQREELERYKKEQERYQQEQREGYDASRLREEYERERSQREQDRIKQSQIEYEEFIANQQRLQINNTENLKRAQQRQATPENVRHLRELIRTRHYLDTQIWSMQGARRAEQDMLVEPMRKSDAVLKEIRSMVELWEKENFSAEEWRLAKRIKEGLLVNDKTVWGNSPPWYNR